MPFSTTLMGKNTPVPLWRMRWRATRQRWSCLTGMCTVVRYMTGFVLGMVACTWLTEMNTKDNGRTTSVKVKAGANTPMVLSIMGSGTMISEVVKGCCVNSFLTQMHLLRRKLKRWKVTVWRIMMYLSKLARTIFMTVTMMNVKVS